MEMTDFLNSGDIAEHWRRIGFFCTPLQSAYLVWHNRTKTLAEKHAAWREIIQSMPDCPVAEGHRKTNMGLSDALAGSLHEFLRAFISLRENLIKRFYQKSDHAVYRYRVLYEGDEDWSRDSWLYDSADDCFDDISVDEKLVPSILYVQLTKQWIGSDRAITLFARADQTILQLDADGLSEAEADLLRAFEWMWLYAWADRLLCRHRECGDETDMTAHGYFQNEDGSVYYECMHHYLDLEYDREKPQGMRRVLTAFSSFERGEIDGELLSIAYHVLLEEERLRREREKLSCFTDEGLRLAGLK